jgi:hypothetical protein
VKSLHNAPTTGGSFSRLRPNKIPILRPGLGSIFLGTNLNSFEANRIFELDLPPWTLACILVLQTFNSPLSSIF